MSGVACAIASSGAGLKANTTSASLLNTAAVTGVRSASVTFNSDGSSSASGGLSSSGGNWYSPTTTGIGSSFWAKYVASSSTSSTLSGSLSDGALHSLSAGANLSVSNSPSTAEGTGSGTVYFYNNASGAGAPAGSCAVTWDVGYSP